MRSLNMDLLYQHRYNSTTRKAKIHAFSETGNLANRVQRSALGKNGACGVVSIMVQFR